MRAQQGQKVRRSDSRLQGAYLCTAECDGTQNFFLVPVLFSGTNFFRDRYQYHPKKGEFSGKKVDILVHYITIVFQLWQNSRHREGPGCHTLASRQTLRCEAYSPLLPEKVLTDSLILVVLCKLHLFHFFPCFGCIFISICRYRS